MTLHELLYEIKSVHRTVRDRLNMREVYTILLIVVVGLGSFGLGRLSKLEETRAPIRIEQASAAVLTSPPRQPIGGQAFQGGERGVVKSSLTKGATSSSEAGVVNAGGQLVASRNGTKYHYPWCSGAQRIAEANKVWFNSIEEARKAGYTPASNCKGLK